MKGTNTDYNPDGRITREQLAAMLYRYTDILGRDTSVSGGVRNSGDSGKASEWALDAVDWAFGSGIISAGADGTLDPRGGVTRAEAEEALTRFFAHM